MSSSANSHKQIDFQFANDLIKIDDFTDLDESSLMLEPAILLQSDLKSAKV